MQATALTRIELPVRLWPRNGVEVVSVRRIEPDEAGELRIVRLVALADAPSAFGSTHASEAARSDREWAERAVAGSSGSDRATLFANESGEIVGLVGGYREEPSDRRVELVSMWVAPRLRRRGVGRALIEGVITWAEETDGDEVALWVTCGNIAAENLYQSMGFVTAGERRPLPSDPSQDEARMVRSLR